MISAPRIASGLEVQQHLTQIAAGLSGYGWTPSISKKADYSVIVDYGISNGRTVHGVQPIIGQTGGGTTTFHNGTASAYGSYGGYANGYYSGTTYTPATYGVVGAVPTTSTVYDRFLFIVISDNRGQSVLEGKCISSGSSSNLSDIVPKMIESFLSDFPGVSGKTKTYTKN